MSKQRNQPRDILEEVMEFDEDKVVSGTSDDDMGKEEVIDWPDGVNEEKFGPKQKLAVKHYIAAGKPKNVDWREFSAGKNYTAPTAKKAVHKAFPESRGMEDLTPAKRLAVAIYAYEGLGADLSMLEEKYPISKTPLSFAKSAYKDLIKDYEGRVTKSKLDAWVSQYKEKGSSQSKGNAGSSSGMPRNVKNKVQSLWRENPNASVKQIQDKLDEELTISQVAGCKSGLNLNTSKSETVTTDKDRNDDSGSYVTIELEFDRNEVKQIIQGSGSDLDLTDKIVDKVLDKAGL